MARSPDTSAHRRPATRATRRTASPTEAPRTLYATPCGTTHNPPAPPSPRRSASLMLSCGCSPSSKPNAPQPRRAAAGAPAAGAPQTAARGRCELSSRAAGPSHPSTEARGILQDRQHQHCRRAPNLDIITDPAAAELMITQVNACQPKCHETSSTAAVPSGHAHNLAVRRHGDAAVSALPPRARAGDHYRVCGG
jgi:hypothetical protein